ncbi:MAG: DUF4198 domain-containing protein [Bacteroidota bacterium]
MKKIAALLVVAGVCLLASTLNAHVLFIRLDTYFLPAQSDVIVGLVNGSFDQSENAIARNRMLDVSVVGPAEQVVNPDTSQWYDEDNAAMLRHRTGDPGTYVIGVSTAPRRIDMEGVAFDRYLRNEGVLDVLADREENGRLGEAAAEQYAKHVKAVVQVGEGQSGSFDTVLGYPIEIVPQQNPYTLSTGDALTVQVLMEGVPVPEQLVFASYDGHGGGHSHAEDGSHIEGEGHGMAVETRTDSEGLAQIPLDHEGRWFIHLIHMRETPDDPEYDYISEWATLTFEIQ